ncbi:DNA polymerase III subunit delta' [Prosthecochloris sp. SCSIO W1101]|uniref:DNA polymerase III subunit delta' n=1 Tax=Prosthecochloris sp. SCSIO W1101 TaxID=2992242 RepID=UPI00223E7F48|nr:DNA polymerase III subunit delta' [Prosthecochloris sp. SCSIO W1101]UZJ40832.1 DNA polymerase III subunit delta' [Prosthecochloris sp. SCSIO W1101]
MSWQDIIGQNLQISILQKAVSSGRLAHAYLFTGPEGTGKESVAFELAKVLNCENPDAENQTGSCGTCRSCMEIDTFMHPDIEYVFPVESALLEKNDPAKAENKRTTEARERYESLIEKKKQNPFFTPSMDRSMGILTEQVTSLQQKASFMPAENGKKVFILSQPEKLHPSAANKLLKLLEEPPGHILFILVSSRPESVLPTIRSRCQILKFSRIKPSDIENWLQDTHPELQTEVQRFIVNFSRGNLGIATEMIDSLKEGGYEAFEGIATRDRAIDYLRKLLSPGKLAEAITDTENISKSFGKQEIVTFLGSLLLFFQDIHHKTINPAWDSFNNPDLGTTIDRFAKSFPNPDFFAISTITEETIRAIKRNVNPLLTLSVYSIRLKNLVGRS